MADPTTVEALTNVTPQSCVSVKCDCNTMWSFAQEFTYLRLSDRTAVFRSTLVQDYTVRARRIAATYARFYLETEKDSNVTKKGRFYWMALAAFASKTVACALDDPRIWATSSVTSTQDGLAKGNFWLFSDITAWHWYYCRFPGSFEMCLESRNSDNYVPTVKAQVRKLPWSAEALSKLKNFKASKEIKAGFAKVKEFEEETDPQLKPEIQLKHLLAIADHEQGVILQPLLYDDPKFTRWLGVQRWPLMNLVSPELQLVFSHRCSTGDNSLKSLAPTGTKLENFTSRMNWITKAASKFHGLMQVSKPYMEGEIRIMAGWVGTTES